MLEPIEAKVRGRSLQPDGGSEAAPGPILWFLNQIRCNRIPRHICKYNAEVEVVINQQALEAATEQVPG